jgi:hypothetical protein
LKKELKLIPLVAGHPATRNKKQETRNKQPETRNKQQATSNKQPETNLK